MDHQYVGIMLNSNYKHEQLTFYEAAARQFELTPCFFKIQDVHRGKKYVKAFVKSGKTYVRTILPIPDVIHNRALFNHQRYLNRVEFLESLGKIVFNYWNRYSKLHIYDLLMQDVSLRTHLPYTVPATFDHAKQIMNMYDSLILKPNIGSIGKGIVKIIRDGERWKVSYATGKSIATTTFKQRFPEILRRKLSSGRNVLQQRLPLALYNGCPFDLRVSVQRNETGIWQVTGIAGKVAAPNQYVTNVARGGTVYSLNTLLQPFPYLEYARVKQDVEHLSIRIAEHLSRYLPRLADIGLDIGITEFGYPVFIECNNRDLRYSFAKGNMIEQWKASYRNPIGYAHYLLKTR